MVNFFKNKSVALCLRDLKRESENFEEKMIISDSSQLKIKGALSFNGFYSFLLENLGSEKKFISPYIAQNIAGSIAKKEFESEKALKSFIKSPSSFKALYSFFLVLLDNLITPEELKNCAKNLSETDSKRLVLCTKVFDEYLKTLDENDFLDFYSAPSFFLSQSELTAKKKYDAPVFVYTENISEAQLSLLESLFETDKINIYACEPDENIAAEKITDFLVFEDIFSEISFIAQKIKTDVKTEGTKFSDYAVLIRDFEDRKKFIDLFRTFDIPLSCANFSDSFENFKTTLIRYFNICAVYEKLGIEGFSKSEFDKLKTLSKANNEMLFEELNSYVRSILTEILEDGYARDRFLSLQEQNKNLSLLSVIYSNLDILKPEDKKIVKDTFDKFKMIFSLYKSNKFLELISLSANAFEAKTDNFKSALNKILGNTKSLLNLYKDILKTKLPVEVLIEMVQNTNEQGGSDPDSLTLASFSAEGEYKYVFIPCMTQNNLPKSNNSINFISPTSNFVTSKELKKNHPYFESLIISDENHLKNESKLLYSAMMSAGEKLILSTHIYDDKKEAAPSVYFQKFLSLLNKTPETIKKAEQKSFIILKDSKNTREKENIIAKNETLKLSPSAISSYLKCPKKYYFKSLLNLKEQSTFAANYGNIVHAVFEVFNSKYLDKYNKDTILVLKDILFDSLENPETALEVGFKHLDIDLINASETLSLAQMKQNFEEAVAELDKNGFFNTVPEEALCEKSFRFEIPELPQVLFDGRIDAILKKGETYEIVDYKTGKNKDNELSYALSENGVNFLTKTGKEPSNIGDYQRKYDYQIPIYYLAAQNAPELSQIKDKISSLGLQYVRPSNKNGGYYSDFIDSTIVEEQKNKIIENLMTTVIDKIRDSEEFPKIPKGESFNCNGCAYAFLCDCEDGEEGEGADE